MLTSRKMVDQNLLDTILHNTYASYAHIDALDQSASSFQAILRKK